MQKMNWSRILLGGAVAGLIMNIGEAALHAGIIGEDSARLYTSFNLAAPDPVANVPALIGMTFLLGIAAVWLYAAIRPRYGAGPRTAVIAGLAVWLFAHLWSGVYLAHGYAGIFTARLAWLPVLWGLVEAPLATLAGAALYKET